MTRTEVCCRLQRAAANILEPKVDGAASVRGDRSLLQVPAARFKKLLLTSRSMAGVSDELSQSRAGEPMNLVQHILEDARKRLVVLSVEALLCEAAVILANPKTPLVVVCDGEGIAVGVLSKTDIMKILADARVDAVAMSTGAIMTKSFLSCHVNQTLQGVWDTMTARSLRSVPILDDSGRPQGVVHARDLAGALLSEVDEEETLLRDYVLGIGYQ